MDDRLPPGTARAQSARLNASGRTAPARRVLLLIALAVIPAVSRAQSVQSVFPSGNAGYDQELGVTVLTRLHPLFQPEGVRVGSFLLSPVASQSLVGNTNVFGGTGAGVAGAGAFGSQSSASLAANSDWVRDSVAADLGVTETAYTTDPSISYTDWNIGLGGGYTIGREQLTLDYSHQSVNQLGTTIGTVSSVTPILDQTDTFNAAYTFDFGAFSLTPDLSASLYRFGDATVGQSAISQSFLGHDDVAGTLTGRYAMDEEGSLVVIAQGLESDYPTRLAGQPDQSSQSVLVLGGLDYQAKGVWRYQLLVGVESRSFTASQYTSETTPIVEGNVIWSPTPLDSVIGTVSRLVEEPQAGGTNGFLLSSLHLQADHEFLPSLYGEVRAGVQIAQYLQSSSQAVYTIGTGANLLLNRRLRLSFDFDYTQQTGAFEANEDAGLTGTVSNAYRQDLATVALHFAL